MASENKKLRRTAFVLGSIVYSIVIFIVAKEYAEPITHALTASIVLAILLCIFEDVIDINHKVAIEETPDKGEMFLRAHKDGNMAELFEKIRNDLHQSLIPDDDSFTLSNHNLALPYYVEYWKKLVQCQAMRHPDSPLIVKITHSCSLDIWENHPLTHLMIELQEDFCKKNGKIERIFCVGNDIDESRFREISKKMIEKGISVFKYNIASNRVLNHHFAWDYLIIPEIHESVIWDSFAHGQPIRRSVHKVGALSFGQYEQQNLLPLFEEIKRHSLPIFNSAT